MYDGELLAGSVVRWHHKSRARKSERSANERKPPNELLACLIFSRCVLRPSIPTVH